MDTIQDYLYPFTQIVATLAAFNRKLIYLTTTPVPYDVPTNDLVIEINKEALAITSSYDIPTVDLYSIVIDQCGAVPYDNCTISLSRPGSPNVHYDDQGYQLFAKYMGSYVQEMLNSTFRE